MHCARFQGRVPAFKVPRFQHSDPKFLRFKFFPSSKVPASQGFQACRVPGFQGSVPVFGSDKKTAHFSAVGNLKWEPNWEPCLGTFCNANRACSSSHPRLLLCQKPPVNAVGEKLQCKECQGALTTYLLLIPWFCRNFIRSFRG